MSRLLLPGPLPPGKDQGSPAGAARAETSRSRRPPRYPPDMTNAGWSACEPLRPHPAWLAGKGGRPPACREFAAPYSSRLPGAAGIERAPGVRPARPPYSLSPVAKAARIPRSCARARNSPTSSGLVANTTSSGTPAGSRCSSSAALLRQVQRPADQGVAAGCGEG